VASASAVASDDGEMAATREIATFDHRAFRADELVAQKRGRSIAVIIPARDEEATVADVVGAVRDALVAAVPLVDELVVVDDGSTDETVAFARKAGAEVVHVGPRDAAPTTRGKGNAMRVGLGATTAEVVAFVDADVTNFAAHFVTGLVGPLLNDESLMLVKGFYERPTADAPAGGGRVTELVARPILSLLFPELTGVRQPLAGETAVRRRALEALELEPGYGVEMGLLLDLYAAHGVGTLAQVDLGSRIHRNRPLAELAPQAREVLAAALERARGR